MMFSLVFLATKAQVNFELLQGPHVVFAPDEIFNVICNHRLIEHTTVVLLSRGVPFALTKKDSKIHIAVKSCNNDVLFGVLEPRLQSTLNYYRDRTWSLHQIKYIM